MSGHWRQYLRGDPIPWLLEEDNPSVRYFALRDLLHRSEDDSDVLATRSAIKTSQPVREILAAQYPEGYWIKPGRGYSPKYRATVWQVMFLADLGATTSEAIDRACRFALEHSFLQEEGLFSATKSQAGVIPCLNGNLLRALRRLGYGDHPVALKASRSLAEQITTQGFCCRGNAPNRASRETWLPCAWGAVKTLRAFALVPAQQRSAVVGEAIVRGVDLLLSCDLATADYPSANEVVSPLWLKFGFPLAYSSDVLEAVDVLAQLGHGGDQQLQGAVEYVLSKQDNEGRWSLEHTPYRSWTRFGQKGKPSKWVTLRALRMLSRLP